MYKKSASELYEPNMSEKQTNLKKSALLVQLSRQLGTKMTGRNHKNMIFRFPDQPHGFRAARNKKHHTFGLFWQFLAQLRGFLLLAVLKQRG